MMSLVSAPGDGANWPGAQKKCFGFVRSAEAVDEAREAAVKARTATATTMIASVAGSRVGRGTGSPFGSGSGGSSGVGVRGKDPQPRENLQAAYAVCSPTALASAS